MGAGCGFAVRGAAGYLDCDAWGGGRESEGGTAVGGHGQRRRHGGGQVKLHCKPTCKKLYSRNNLH
eukprot:1032645-Rhodomonas_salina.4